ncbi:MAG TPA: hypothetical protein VFN18_04685 [Solirubrobacterales bacterium]|nr:hypothetical protein [Solirubrobacterales bacterium]
MMLGAHRLARAYSSKNAARQAALWAALALASAAAVAPGIAAATLGGHGSEREVLLATKLRPRLLFDSGERWRPVEVGSFASEIFVDGSGHEACWEDPPRCDPLAGLDELSANTAAPAYLDIHGSGKDGTEYRSPKRRCRAADSAAVDCNAGQRAVIYYRRTSHGGRWYWDYWWFLRYNEYTGPLHHCNFALCSNHEGDWEGMTVVTTASSKPKIVEAIYAAHRNRVLVKGALLPLTDGHPLIFIAQGTHAGYPYRCDSGCKQYEKKLGFRLPEDPHDGAVSWGGNSDSSCAIYGCVRPLPEIGNPGEGALPAAGAWAGWGGRWGETCHRGCRSPGLQASPRSPGVQPRFECPWVATDRALSPSDRSGPVRSRPAGDARRRLTACAAQRDAL